jgi:hypothetical protein
MEAIRKPKNESAKVRLSRIKKEMAQPRIAKSAREESHASLDWDRPRHKPVLAAATTSSKARVRNALRRLDD